MLQLALPILALFLSLILLVVGNSMLGTLLAVRLDIEGFETGTAGLILAQYAVGFVLGSLYGLRIIRRVGHIRAFAALGALASAAILLHPLVIETWSWILLRLLVGFCVAGLMLITESWVNTRATAGNRGALLALYMILFYSAAAGGQFLLGVGDPADYPLFSLAAILVALSVIPLSLTRSTAPDLHEGERMGLGRLIRLAPLGVLTAFLSGVVVAAFSAIGPIYASQVGLEITRISVFMGVAVLVAMAFQWPVGLLSDYLPRGKVIVGLALAGLLAALLAALLGTVSTLALFLLVPLFVGLTAALYPVSLAFTHDHLGHAQIVPASATLLLSFGAGTILGPIGGASVMGLIGPPGLFLFSAAVLGVLIAATVVLLRRQSEIPVAEQAHCVGVAPVSTPVIVELDPRNKAFAAEAAERTNETPTEGS
jgi:MFS family permease